MRKLPSRDKKQSFERKQKPKGKKRQHQTRAQNSPGWDAANDLVEWLFASLDQRGITNEQLSQATGIKVETIASWRKTPRLPSLENMANCAGYLGYELIPLREPLAVTEDLHVWPVRDFRAQLLNSTLEMKARAAGRTLEHYIEEHSSDEAESAAKDKYRKIGEVVDKQPSDAKTSDIVKAAKVGPGVRSRLRWNG
jgi:hypothetical protein